MSASETMEPAIRIVGLTKDFSLPLRGKKLRAVDGLSLTVERGAVYGLLGPNGSGKSTTIKALLGLLEPTTGACEIFGVPSAQTRSRVDVGYLPEAPYFYRFLSGRELVGFYAKLSGVAPPRLAGRVDDVLHLVGLLDAAHRRIGTYSKGMLQRVGLAQALVHDPQLLILDEPTAGVDPVGSAEITALILRLKAQGKTVLLCSHLLAQVEGICDRIAILDRGRLVLEGRVDELVGGGQRRSVVVDNLSEETAAELRTWLASRGGQVVAIERPRADLERVFLQHVRGDRESSARTTQSGEPSS